MPAHAITITESTDFPFGSPSPLVGTLDAGTNSVSGNLTGYCSLGCSNGDYSDYFEFIVGADDHLTQVEMSVTGTGPSGLDLRLFMRQTVGGQFNSSDRTAILLGGANSASESFTPALTAGRYELGIYVLGDEGGTSSLFNRVDYDIDWTMTLSVERPLAPVPLPAGLPLMLTALAGGVLIQRKRSYA